jgi:hypothetical protein
MMKCHTCDMKHTGIWISFLLFLLLFPGQLVWSSALPVIAVMDFVVSDVSQMEAKIIVDLLSYNLYETERCLVIDRRERDNVLKGFDVKVPSGDDISLYIEIGELLQVDFIVTGELHKRNNHFDISIRMHNLILEDDVVSITKRYAGFDELVEGCRPLSRNLLENIAAHQQSGTYVSKVMRRMMPITIKEEILIIFQKDNLTLEKALSKELLYFFCKGLLKNEHTTLFLSFINYDEEHPDIALFGAYAQENGYHSFAFIQRRGIQRDLCLYSLALKQRLRISFDDSNDMSIAYGRKQDLIEEHFRLLSQKVLVKEIKKNIEAEEKLDSLIFSQKILSHDYSLRMSIKMVKSVIIEVYHPNLNIVSFEADFFWYYGTIIGIGGGYGYSLGYPGTVDSKLRDFPLISQHELRFIPFSFRTGSRLGLVINAFLSFQCHNAYTIVYYPEGVHEYTDETLISFLSPGLNCGILINFTENIALFIDCASIKYIFVLGETPYDDTSRRISGDIGGIGINLRF